jgi:CTP-dependent riboflavin kinase
MGRERELVFHGRVASGLGEGQYFTRLEWVREQFLAKFGFDPTPGTFNLKIEAEEMALQESLRHQRGVEIVPANPAFCPAKCFPVRMGAAEGALVIPLVEGYRQGVLEIMAAVNLRQALGVQDGDLVEVRVLLRG